jgi:hypothetical protein
VHRKIPLTSVNSHDSLNFPKEALTCGGPSSAAGISSFSAIDIGLL